MNRQTGSSRSHPVPWQQHKVRGSWPSPSARQGPLRCLGGLRSSLLRAWQVAETEAERTGLMAQVAAAAPGEGRERLKLEAAAARRELERIAAKEMIGTCDDIIREQAAVISNLWKVRFLSLLLVARGLIASGGPGNR